jgi:hypothetical protein
MLPYKPSGDRPTYDLQEVQRLVGQGELTRFISNAAILGADALLIDRDGIVDVVLSLEPQDFYKTMEAERRPGLWQDVYHRRLGEVELYIKLQIDHRRGAVVIQFTQW